MKITNLKDTDIWKNITYWCKLIRWVKWNLYKYETWKLKSFNNETQTAWIVFKCNDDWSNFQNYTGESCSYSDLEF